MFQHYIIFIKINKRGKIRIRDLVNRDSIVKGKISSMLEYRAVKINNLLIFKILITSFLIAHL